MSRLLIKERNGIQLAQEVILAESTAARMKGLLGRSSLAPQTAMLIRPCRSIHMWFMQFSIDVLFLDAELRILKISHTVRPWQLAFAPRRTHCVVEMPAGEAKTANLTPGLHLIEEH